MDLSFGTRLREQRERQQVTLAAISKETKISVAALQGLERDDLSRWPGGIFRRAYVRSYAQAIGLEPETVVREFLEHHPEPIVQVPDVLVAQVMAGVGSQSRPSNPMDLLRAGLAGLRPLREAFRRSAESSAEPSADPIPDVAPTPETEPSLLADSSAAAEVAIAPTESSRRRPAARPVKRAGSRLAAPARTAQRDVPGVERDLASVARLCTALGCARDQTEVRDVLEDAVRILRARGVIVWAWDGIRSALCPVVAYGYSNTVLRKLPRVGLNADNAIASAFLSASVHVVKGTESITGAVAAPLLSTDGCVGVLAFEFRNGGEQRECVRAFATILGAQLSTLVPVSALAEAVSA